MSENNCPRCNAGHRPISKFCPECNYSLDVFPERLQNIVGKRWHPKPNEFAVHVESDQLKGWINLGLEVDSNQTGLLFNQGRFQQEIVAGPVRLKSFPDRILDWFSKRTVSAVLMRTGLYSVPVQGRISSKDGVDIGFECVVDVQLGDRNKLYETLLADSHVVSQTSILVKIAPPVRQAVFEIMGSCRASELVTPHPELRERFVDAIEHVLDSNIAKYGLKIGSISSPIFSSDQLRKYQEKRAEISNDLRNEQLELKAQELRQRLNAETYRLERLLAREEMKNEIAKLERGKEFDEVKKRLEHQVQIQDLDLKREMENAVDSYANKVRERDRKNQSEDDLDEDSKSLRSHLLATLEIHRQSEISSMTYSLRKKELEQNQDLSQMEREERLAVAEQEFEAEQSQKNKSLDYRIASWNKVKSTHLEFDLKKFYADLEKQKAATQSNHEESLLDLDLKEKELRAKLLEIEKTDELHVKKLREKSELHREHLAGLTDIQAKRGHHEEDRADRQHLRTMQEQREEREFQLKKTQLDNEKSDVSRVAEAPVENAAIMADILKMDIKRSMTAEQLEQIAAENSAAAADALKEKHRAMAAAHQNSANKEIELYERIINELKSSRELDQNQFMDLVNRIERIGTSGQELLRDVGVAAANAEKPSGISSQDNMELPTGQSTEAVESLTKAIRKLVNTLKQNSDS